jgi:hypothetical protein
LLLSQFWRWGRNDISLMAVITPKQLLRKWGGLWLILGCAGGTWGADYYVATTGNNSNDGLSVGSPFLTIGRAVSVLQAGDTIHIRGDAGAYQERVGLLGLVGTAESPITLKTYDGDPPAVLDLTGTPVPLNDTKEGILKIENCQHIAIHQLVLKNFRAAGTNAQQRLQIPTGIYINSNGNNLCSDITISKCTVTGIWNTFSIKRDLTGNAHGIIAMGRSTQAIERIRIDSCLLYDLRLGASEALTLNGNVRDFRVTNNIVYDCNNIGIDFIGHESVYTGPVVPEVSEDQARYGVCKWNRVYRIDSATNPAYGGNFTNTYPSEVERNKTRAAAGIYVDGGRNIEIAENEVQDCNIGIDIASEHFGKFASHCQVLNNRVDRSHIGGIFLGGGWTGNGGVEHIQVQGNALFNNDLGRTGSGQVRIGNEVRSTTVSGNVMIAGKREDGFSPFYVMKFLTNGSNLVIDHNIYAGVPVVAGVPQGNVSFDWHDNFQITFSGWKQVSGQDAHSSFVALPVPRTIRMPDGHELRLFEPMAGQ